MLPVLGSSTVVNIVGVCDSILYKAISGVLMPTVLQALPDRWARALTPHPAEPRLHLVGTVRPCPWSAPYWTFRYFFNGIKCLYFEPFVGFRVPKAEQSQKSA